MSFRKHPILIDPIVIFCIVNTWFQGLVIPAQAGIQFVSLDSRLRENDKQSQF